MPRDELEVILDAVADGITVQDREGRIVYANDATAQTAGFDSREAFLAASPEELIERFEILDADGTPLSAEQLPGRSAMAGLPAERLVQILVRATGETRWILIRARPVLDPDGSVRRTVNIFTNVTALREREEWRAVIEASPDGMIGADADGRVMLVNSQAERMFGYSRDELMGRAAATILPERFREFLNTSRLEILAQGVRDTSFISRVDLAGLRKDGSEFPIAVAFARLDTPGGVVLLGTVRDITERKAAEERIAYLAYHDALTGLPNRAMLEQHLERALERTGRRTGSVALFYIDLDEFKTVNDSLGHLAGDELLRQVGARLRSLTRGGDLLARQGGDEFLLLVDTLDPPPGQSVADSAERLAERIHELLREPFPVEGHDLRIGASVGVSLYPSDADDADGLLRHADAALYAGKEAGRGRSVLYGQMTGPTADRLSLTTRLRRAVEQEEFVLHWQPVVDLDTGEVCSAEALIRWEDPERGLVAPAGFIGAAEGLGLIGAIGEWVMRAACAQAATWGDLPVAVNVSPVEARDKGLAGRMSEELRRCGLDPGAVTVELTESAAAEGGIDTVTTLVQAGFPVAIDDFGTGHSSLSRLAGLPVSCLKIDRTFVAGLDLDDPRAQAVVRVILDLGRSLGMQTIAEGIERPEQLATLRALGCRYGQGYLLGRPVPAGELPRVAVPLPVSAA